MSSNSTQTVQSSMNLADLGNQVLETLHSIGGVGTIADIHMAANNTLGESKIKQAVYLHLAPNGSVNVTMGGRVPLIAIDGSNEELDDADIARSSQQVAMNAKAKIHTIVAIDLTNVHNVLQYATERASADPGIWVRGYTSARNTSFKANSQVLPFVKVCDEGTQKHTHQVRLIMDVAKKIQETKATKVAVCSTSLMLSDFASVLMENEKYGVSVTFVNNPGALHDFLK